ncbi:MAG: polyhydroxyalkanoic acid system family protein [Burkholderiaceae bacterium]|nr:polyhydroxyalkanoic acid system family protein [Burkholderiaceae bacterium]
MADIELERPHNMSLAQAKNVAQKVAEEMATEYGLQSQWEGNSLNFSRPGIHGTLSVDSKTMRVAVSLSFLFKPFAGKFREQMSVNMEKLLTQEISPKSGRKTPPKSPT